MHVLGRDARAQAAHAGAHTPEPSLCWALTTACAAQASRRKWLTPGWTRGCRCLMLGWCRETRGTCRRARRGRAQAPWRRRGGAARSPRIRGLAARATRATGWCTIVRCRRRPCTRTANAHAAAMPREPYTQRTASKAVAAPPLKRPQDGNLGMTSQIGTGGETAVRNPPPQPPLLIGTDVAWRGAGQPAVPGGARRDAAAQPAARLLPEP